MQKEDRSALHEAMEQQTISVAKAGITATLKSRCALLGAANPKYGRFDDFVPIGEQINMPASLLSRFDLIFVMTDKPEQKRDSAIAEHILKAHGIGELIAMHDPRSTGSMRSTSTNSSPRSPPTSTRSSSGNMLPMRNGPASRCSPRRQATHS
jgi:DNA replicative helicase MCM subunit Mcm2 (Cdc46/Mcm family)